MEGFTIHQLHQSSRKPLSIFLSSNTMYKSYVHFDVAFSIRSVCAYRTLEEFLSSVDVDMLLQVAFSIVSLEYLLTVWANTIIFTIIKDWW